MRTQKVERPTVVWGIRHGETGVPPRRCLGWSDPGLADPERTRERLAGYVSKLSGVEVIVSSDLQRAVETARLLSGLLGVSMQVDPRLREMHFGTWERMSWEMIEERQPEAFQAFMDDWLTATAPHGESFADVRRRVESFWANRRAKLPDRVAFVLHRGSWTALASHILSVDPAELFGREFDYARASRLDCRRRAIEWNIL